MQGLRYGAEITRSINAVTEIAQEEKLIDKISGKHLDAFVNAHQLLKDHENRDQIVRELMRVYVQHKEKGNKELAELMIRHMAAAKSKEHIVALHRTLKAFEEHGIPHEHRTKILRAARRPEDIVKIARALEALDKMGVRHLQPEAILAAAWYDDPAEFLERSIDDVRAVRNNLPTVFEKVATAEGEIEGKGNRYEMLAVLGKDRRIAATEREEEHFKEEVIHLADQNKLIERLRERKYEP